MEKAIIQNNLAKKQEIHPLADEKNFIDERQGHLVLRCGARKKKGVGFCKSIAGAGTNHPGHGRCKFCGGASTGPKTKEGVEKVAQNSRKHGLYARRFTEEEQETYEQLLKQKNFTLDEEISLLKTKLKSYYDYVWRVERGQGKKGLIKNQIKNGVTTEFERGSIEDPFVHKTLEQIRRLIATANSLDTMDSQTLVEQINKELMAASQAAVKASWEGGMLSIRVDKMT